MHIGFYRNENKSVLAVRSTMDHVLFYWLMKAVKCI